MERWSGGRRCPSPREAGRRRALALLVLGVLALHAWLVGAVRWGSEHVPVPGRQGALQVRVLAPPAAAAAPEDARREPRRETRPATAATPPARPFAQRSPASTRGPAATAGTTATTSPSSAAAPHAGAASGAPAAPAPAAAGSAPPLYPTRLPPAGEWSYALQRNGRSAGARLSWQHDGERYTARLDAPGAQLQWDSRGRLDDAGLAPERFVDRRDRRRDAANFEPEAGRIGYSGSGADQPAWRGSQDRLSLLLQLAAVLDARRSPPHAGEAFVLHVSGARGDAALWRFEVQGPERLALPDGRQRFALKLLREPTQPYDTRAEVWTDPDNHHLPLRVRFSNGGHVLEMELQPAAAPEVP